MTRTLIVLAALLALSAPMALAAPPAGKGKPDNPGNSAAAPGQSAEKNAAKKCKAMRKNDLTGFKAQYGEKPNAFGKCVAAQEKKAEAAEEAEEARENAAKKCKKERDQLGLVEFKKKYAPAGHPNGANAFGKCVSKLSKQATS
ncbi:MAG TPA: hypothetical protein VMK83_01750 [Gaiellaceae bacterium]|nr:hypothetical protein [Gaiellaceae bacterium]